LFAGVGIGNRESELFPFLDGELGIEKERDDDLPGGLQVCDLWLATRYITEAGPSF